MSKMTKNSNHIPFYSNVTKVQKLELGLQGLKTMPLKEEVLNFNSINLQHLCLYQ